MALLVRTLLLALSTEALGTPVPGDEVRQAQWRVGCSGFTERGYEGFVVGGFWQGGVDVVSRSLGAVEPKRLWFGWLTWALVQFSQKGRSYSQTDASISIWTSLQLLIYCLPFFGCMYWQVNSRNSCNIFAAIGEHVDREIGLYERVRTFLSW